MQSSPGTKTALKSVSRRNRCPLMAHQSPSAMLVCIPGRRIPLLENIPNRFPRGVRNTPALRADAASQQNTMPPTKITSASANARCRTPRAETMEAGENTAAKRLPVDPAPHHLVTAPRFPGGDIERFDVVADADDQSRGGGKAAASTHRTLQKFDPAKEILARADRHTNFEFHGSGQLVGSALADDPARCSRRSREISCSSSASNARLRSRNRRAGTPA